MRNPLGPSDRGWVRRSVRPLRVLHCPTATGGNPQSLARAERALGLESVSVLISPNPFNYSSDIVLLREGEPPWYTEIRRWKLLWKALRQFDVMHFNFGKTILPNWIRPMTRVPGWILPRLWDLYARTLHMKDLPILKELGKGIFVTYQGDDARQGGFSRSHFRISMATEVEPGYYSSISDHRKREAIRIMARFADRIYALNPDLLHVLPERSEFLPYATVDLSEWVPTKSPMRNRTPVVIHAPSRRGPKGTRFILSAVDRLKREGIDFEFILAENLSHSEARALYGRADLVVDQLLAGWYGGVSVELMALGKPSMCYIRDEDLKFIPPAMAEELPFIRAEPDTVYERLKCWLTERVHELPALGARSRSFVERWHDPMKIARRLKSDYESVMDQKRRG